MSVFVFGSVGTFTAWKYVEFTEQRYLHGDLDPGFQPEVWLDSLLDGRFTEWPSGEVRHNTWTNVLLVQLEFLMQQLWYLVEFRKFRRIKTKSAMYVQQFQICCEEIYCQEELLKSRSFEIRFYAFRSLLTLYDLSCTHNSIAKHQWNFNIYQTKAH